MLVLMALGRGISRFYSVLKRFTSTLRPPSQFCDLIVSSSKHQMKRNIYPILQPCVTPRNNFLFPVIFLRDRFRSLLRLCPLDHRSVQTIETQLSSFNCLCIDLDMSIAATPPRYTSWQEPLRAQSNTIHSLSQFSN